MENFDKSLLTNNGQSGPIPAPPQKEIEVRTMESDLKAFKESGGEVPISGEKETYVSQTEEKSVNEIANPYVTNPQNLQNAAWQVPNQTPAPAAPTKNSGIVKSILILIVAILATILIGYLGYAYIFPMFFK